MSDHELIQIAAWLAVVAAVVWLVPGRLQRLVLVLGGAAILAVKAPLSLAMLIGFILVSYAAPRAPRFRTVAVAAAIGGVTLAYAGLMWASRRETGLSLILPLGMAYYVLRTIHYMVEAHLGRLRAHTFLDYAAYQALPSALLFGPIHRFDEFQRDLARRRWDSDAASHGLGRILSGALKVVFIGNYLIVQRLGYDPATSLADGAFAEVYRSSALYWANLYFQFGGYSDIAIGFAALMGFSIRENFNWPFVARNIGDFWRRWHMSLSSWCRDYVYMPVMALSRVHVLAISASMLTLGLWHALSLHYVLWGLYHAVGLTLWRRWSAWTGPAYEKAPRTVQWAWAGCGIVLTLHFVIFSFAVTTYVERWIWGR